MFYLFILESIGTSELILIGLVALIVFGPRKLPEFAKMLGKARNEFKRTTDEFKQTWEREVDFESEDKKINREIVAENSNSIQKKSDLSSNEITAPEIKELSQAEFEENYTTKEIAVPVKSTENLASKRDWL